ncbi:5-carboxymethyl-2-hydroxymuconate Delta-isomerase [Trinickia acidisoli]|uniref:5-carboxymethyl-2-hydroxymuconate Delta-isomerase n=1 Tax=Trinickia acidisoli TaxID=2767482 RepID=UPI001A8D29DF|nr:5-carboxymethyl-2-hydroxymuconate Delta-isomerase [Trinickia acidisoli]
MPHVIVEYTDNLGADARIPVLLETINGTLIAQDGVYPTGGIRSRAIELHNYRVADGKEDDAFVHVTLKIGAGRADAVKKRTCDTLFDAVKAHFADAFSRRYLALSLELVEFNESGSHKRNNIHDRFRRER